MTSPHGRGVGLTIQDGGVPSDLTGSLRTWPDRAGETVLPQSRREVPRLPGGDAGLKNGSAKIRKPAPDRGRGCRVAKLACRRLLGWYRGAMILRGSVVA